MTPDIVVDVGNSLIKWGRCAGGAVVEKANLSHDDPDAWEQRLRIWRETGPRRWAVAGVHPAARDHLVTWLRQRGEDVEVIDRARQLPLTVRLEKPDAVGIDRLLSAVAANKRRAPGVPAIVVGAGTAVTVDWLAADGGFCGGAILPGFHLMAHALHQHTALLPLIALERGKPPLPGTSTIAAMQAGVYWAVAGGTRAVIQELLQTGTSDLSTPVPLFLTGGDAPLLQPALNEWMRGEQPSGEVVADPLLTLEGIRLTAEALP